MTAQPHPLRCETCKIDDEIRRLIAVNLTGLSFEYHDTLCKRIVEIACDCCASHSAAAAWKILESIPDKNGIVIIGIKEDPTGAFVSRNKALEYLQHENEVRVKARADGAKAERERVLKEYLEILNSELPDYDCRARLKHLMRKSLREGAR